MNLLFEETCRSWPVFLRRGGLYCVIPKWHANPTPKFLFLGEAPGENEERQGEPFIGRSGQFLRSKLQEAEISLGDCIFSNSCLCAPRDAEGSINTPQASEYLHCLPHSLNLIRRYGPKMVVAVGGVALQSLMKPKGKSAKITTVHGRILKMKVTPQERYLVFRSWVDDTDSDDIRDRYPASSNSNEQEWIDQISSEWLFGELDRYPCDAYRSSFFRPPGRCWG